MPLEQSVFLYAALGLGVILVVEGLYFLIVDIRTGPQAQVNRRLALLAHGVAPEEVLRNLRRRQRDESDPFVRYVPFLPRLEPLIAQAGLSLSVGRVLLWMAGIALCTTALLDLLTPAPMPIAIFGGITIGIAAPIVFLARRKGNRVRLFEEQLPGALDLLVRSLRIGHPLSSAVGVVAREMPDPIGTEFGIVVDEATYGLELPEAIDNMNGRIDLQDLRYLTVAINIQYTSGGNLAEILSGLSQVIRVRFQMFRKVKAITVEGRISAMFLSVFPILLIFAMGTIRPGYYTQVADYPYFKHLVVATIVLLLINLIFMRTITKLKI